MDDQHCVQPGCGCTETALAFFRRQGFGQDIRHVYLSLNLENHPKYIERKAEAEEEWDE